MTTRNTAHVTLDDVRPVLKTLPPSEFLLGLDTATGRPVAADLYRYPHVYVFTGAGSGTTSTVRSLVAQFLTRDDVERVDVFDPKTYAVAREFGALSEHPKMHVHPARDSDAPASAWRAVKADVDARFARVDNGDQPGHRRVLAVENVTITRGRMDPADRDEFMDMLGALVTQGRSINYHLILTGPLSAGRFSDLAVDNCGTILLSRVGQAMWENLAGSAHPFPPEINTTRGVFAALRNGRLDTVNAVFTPQNSGVPA